jgi:hypothetical protein
MMSTSVYTILNLFNFIRNYFQQTCVRKSLCTYKSCWRRCPRASILTTNCTYRSLKCTATFEMHCITKMRFVLKGLILETKRLNNNNNNNNNNNYYYYYYYYYNTYKYLHQIDMMLQIKCKRSKDKVYFIQSFSVLRK